MNQDIQIAYKNSRREATKKIIYGLIWCLICLWLCYGSARDDFDELKLIRNAQLADGVITECFEERDVGDEGGKYVARSCSYMFSLPDGTILDSSMNVSNKIKEETDVKIEYLLVNPQTNRIQGEGNSTFFDWAWRKLGLGLGLLALFTSPGIILIRNGIKEFRNPKVINSLEEQDLISNRRKL